MASMRWIAVTTDGMAGSRLFERILDRAALAGAHDDDELIVLADDGATCYRGTTADLRRSLADAVAAEAMSRAGTVEQDARTRAQT